MRPVVFLAIFAAAAAAHFSVIVPPELSVDAACSPTKFDPETRALSWSAVVAGYLQAGVVDYCSVDFRVDPALKTGTPFVLTATMTTSAPDADAANNTASVAGVVTAASDLEVTNIADRTSLRPGDPLTYTFTVRNLGDLDAKNVVVTDLLSRDVTVRSFAQIDGPAAVLDDAPHDTAGMPVCTEPRCGVYIEAHIPALASHASATFRLAVDVKPSVEAAYLYNAALVQSSGLDPNRRNDRQAVTTGAGPYADLVAGSRQAPGHENQLPITIEITNNGPDAVANVSVEDTLEGKSRYAFDYRTFKFLSVTPSQGTCSDPQELWSGVLSPPEPPIGWRLTCALGAMDPARRRRSTSSSSPRPRR